MTAKQAAIAAAEAAPAPYSASFGRTLVASIHAAPQQGLSLVRGCAAAGRTKAHSARTPRLARRCGSGGG